MQRYAQVDSNHLKVSVSNVQSAPIDPCDYSKGGKTCS